MPKVHKRVARKDYPAFGIVKGQEHYHWVIKTGPRSSREYRQLTPPRRSQLTSSEYFSRLWDLFDNFQGNTPDDIKQLAEDLRELGQEQQEKFDNMPDGLQQGDVGQMLEERASNCESSADEIDNIAEELEQAQNDYEEALKEYETEKAEFEALSEAEQEGAIEPEEPEAVDVDSFIDRISENEPC